MSTWVRVAAVGDVALGQAKTVSAGDVEVALFNVGGTFYAISNTCRHRGGPLGEGELEDTTVTCPWHGWQFDVTTGATLRDYKVGVPSYRVEVQGDEVFVELP